jgi:hypothetical protein
MSIQDIFYLLGSIFMGLGIILLIIIGIVLWIIKNKITELHKLIDEKVNKISRLADDPGSLAADLGSRVASGAISTVKGMMTKKGK